MGEKFFLHASAVSRKIVSRYDLFYVTDDLDTFDIAEVAWFVLCAMSWATVHAAVTQQVTTPTTPSTEMKGKIDWNLYFCYLLPCQHDKYGNKMLHSPSAHVLSNVLTKEHIER